jgi:hypothetical protein
VIPQPILNLVLAPLSNKRSSSVSLAGAFIENRPHGRPDQRFTVDAPPQVSLSFCRMDQQSQGAVAHALQGAMAQPVVGKMRSRGIPKRSVARHGGQ